MHIKGESVQSKVRILINPGISEAEVAVFHGLTFLRPSSISPQGIPNRSAFQLANFPLLRAEIVMTSSSFEGSALHQDGLAALAHGENGAGITVAAHMESTGHSLYRRNVRSFG